MMKEAQDEGTDISKKSTIVKFWQEITLDQI